MAKLKKKAAEALARQSTGDFGFTPKAQAPSPDAAMYGVFQPAYAQALAAPTDSAGGDLANRVALSVNARNEVARYEEQLAAAQAAQIALADREGRYGLMGKVLDKEPDGLIGMRSVGQTPDGGYGVFNDPVMQAAANAVAINSEVAATRKDNAGSIKDLYESGIKTDPVVAGGYMTHPLQSERDEYGVFNPQGVTASDATAAYSADEGLTAEQQIQIEADRNAARIAASADDNDADVTTTTTPTGSVTHKIKGPYDAVVAARQRLIEGGANPATITTEVTEGPKAVARGGGATATKAAPRGHRNNNPGNIKDGRYAKSLPGYAGSDGTFAKFDTMEAGYDAMTQLLTNNYISKGYDTPRKIVERWAPGSENSKASRDNYAAAIARKLGISIDTKVSRNHAPFIARAIDEFENGRPARTAQASGQPTRVNRLAGIMAEAQKRGHQVAKQGNTIVITAPSGKSIRLDANGNRL